MAHSRLLTKLGFHKRSGLQAPRIIYLLLIWVWVGRESIALFARQSLRSFADAHKDALYDLLAREELNWRAFHGAVALKVYRAGQLKNSPVRAYVLDDSVKTRRGKRLEGVSRHFDHLSGRTVKGQQVLTLGLATQEAFLPLDSDIFISNVGAHPLKADFHDGRSVEARRYAQARDRTKPELAAGMLRRALRQGLEADVLLADAWFGTKTMISTALDLNLTAILRMKKNAMKYRLRNWNNGEAHTELLDANGLYQTSVRKHWKRLSGLPYRCQCLDVELSLESDGKEQWIPVRLLFVRGVSQDADSPAGAKSWALFLSTDRSLSPAAILEIDALRWSIEVYFKEAKQYLGLLWEQTETFASHLASIHLTAVRYCLLAFAQIQGAGTRVCEVRTAVGAQLSELDFAKRLWGFFRALIAEAVDGLPTMGFGRRSGRPASW
ncbi:Transposase [Thiorhodovibrio winogradskyi]|uniref:Transposase n=1 Tax=Thiorhodovibrio winogradskyi TaxID=77007 RepID=A0ABZ0SE26_9GAMM|nr:transposase [Thiorhodovibrio winogradskyi]